MIYLEIKKASDPLLLGLYEFEFNQITLGRSKKNDLIFLERELPLKYLTLKIIQTQLVVQSITRSPFFFINGKKVSGALKLNVDDIIAFGHNEIRIVKYASTNKSVDLAVEFAKFEKNSPELKFALNFIEDVLIDLEKDQNV